MTYLFLGHPTCSTVAKARKWLAQHNIAFVERSIVDQNPTVIELNKWIPLSGKPIKAFFNTSGMLYREQGLKDKLPMMNKADQIERLASNGMLVKRPLLILPDKVLVGFKQSEWENALL